MSSPMPQNPPPQSSGCGWVFAILFGCGTVAMLLLLGCGVLGFMGYRFASNQIGQLAEEYRQRGYTQSMGQLINVDQSPKEPTVYVAQVVNINGPMEVDIAIVAQMAEIKADIDGDLDFKGQMLTVHEGAVIHGDLTISSAQVVTVNGKVEGKITGAYQVLRYQGNVYRNGETPPSIAPPKDSKDPLEPSYRIDLDEDEKPASDEKPVTSE